MKKIRTVDPMRWGRDKYQKTGVYIEIQGENLALLSTLV